MSPIDYSLFAIPKVRSGASIAESKRAKRLDRQQQERECREVVKRRDHGKCRIPGCTDRAEHLHHIVYRSKGGKWRPENICSLCPSHHSMVHLGKISISGNADDELTITGSREALAFKL